MSIEKIIRESEGIVRDIATMNGNYPDKNKAEKPRYGGLYFQEKEAKYVVVGNLPLKTSTGRC